MTASNAPGGGAAAGLPDRGALLRRFQEVRTRSMSLAAPLAPEDMVVQSMPDASPTKWHLAHTTWFFEALVLRPGAPWYDPVYAYLFNSYYNALGDQFPRPRRGLITRPTVAEVERYRRHVDDAVAALIDAMTDEELARLGPVIEIGTHHEQQHQELILTDIKHALAQNPLRPAYRAREEETGDHAETSPLRWSRHEEGVHHIGHAGPGFAYDNEGPRHRVLLPAFEIADRPVANADVLSFVEDGGYRRPELWLSEGWAAVQRERWEAPLYLERRDGRWWQFTLAGVSPVNPAEPACHLSYYEADAFARWAGARLPTEFEWEVAAAPAPMEGTFMESERFHPAPAPAAAGRRGYYGDVWQWTSSSYAPYPGYRAGDGALGEYNGKFMCNQYVLRGGSCATPRSHIRRTYRNFWAPHTRFQFSGCRLARDAGR